MADTEQGSAPRWAWVAGASDGLGRAFAEALAARGYALLLIARRAELVAEVGKQLADRHDVLTRAVPFDLADDGLQAAAEQWLREAPPTLLVYNAAWAATGRFLEQPLDTLRKVVDVNITAPLILARLCGAAMREKSGAGIVLMSSLSGEQGSPRIATYAASKAFNTILAEGLWDELRAEGIDVIACVAGAISTPAYLAVTEKPAPGTLPPEEVARVALDSLGASPSVVPGWSNKLSAMLLGRLLPRRKSIAIMRKATKNLKAEE